MFFDVCPLFLIVQYTDDCISAELVYLRRLGRDCSDCTAVASTESQGRYSEKRGELNHGP